MSLQTPLPPPAPETELCSPDDIACYRTVLSNPNFLALWVGQIFSQLADRVIFVVFIALVVKYFGTEDRYNSYLYIAFAIPAILLTAIAGVFVDRWPRRRVLVTTNLMRAACVAFLPFAAQGSGWLIYAMAFLISCATQFFVPAEAATIPTIVPKSHLMVANSLFTTTMMASVIFGFALGDPLINIFSLGSVHWAIVALFILASVALLFVKAPPPKVRESQSTTLQAGFANFWAEMQDGFQYIWTHRMVLNALLKLTVLFSTVVAVCILFISFAKAMLYDDAQVASRKFSYIVTFSGIGMASGALLLGQYFKEAKRGLMVFGGFLVAGACLSLLAETDWIAKDAVLYQLPAVALDFMYLDPVTLSWRMFYTYSLVFMMGVGAAFVAIPLQSLLHEIIPEDKRGKVMGVQFTLLSTFSTVPVLVAGLGVEQIGIRWMLLIIGLPLFLLGIIGLVNRVQSHHEGSLANW